MRQLGLADLTDEHLQLLRDAELGSRTKARDWVRMLFDGELELWEAPGGIVGLQGDQSRLYVQVLSGRGLVRPALREWLRERAAGRPIEGFVTNPRLRTLYERLGAKAVGTYMRIV